MQALIFLLFLVQTIKLFYISGNFNHKKIEKIMSSIFQGRYWFEFLKYNGFDYRYKIVALIVVLHFVNDINTSESLRFTRHALSKNALLKMKWK